MSLAAVVQHVQHVQILEASGLVRTQKLGRTRTCSLNPVTQRSAGRWICERRILAERRLDRLGEYRAEPARHRNRRTVSAGQPGLNRRGDPMTEQRIIHDTFAIERTYPPTASRVLAAFASKEAKNAWSDTGDLTEPGADASGTTTTRIRHSFPGGSDVFNAGTVSRS
jgi:hypothetical protein